MKRVDPDRRFAVALAQARRDWAVADPDVSAALAACARMADRINVPFFGTPHQVTHPGGETTRQQGDETRTAHAAVSIVLLHYLLTADGTGIADQWVTFRELPGGLFYAQAFADHAEGVIAAKFGTDVAGFRAAAATLGGLPLDLADAAYRFQALPRVPMAVLLWAGDDELRGQARILYDSSAGHFLPTEDLSGLGDWLAHQLTR